MSKTAKFDLSKPTHFIALGFGAGLLRPAPGTWGTLAAIPLYLALMQTPASSAAGYAVVLLLTFALGVVVCGQAAQDVGEHDHSAIVWDEIVGFGVTMFAVSLSWQTVLAGFLLFRLFDIVKPWPIDALDRSVHGGLGIMLDDVLAGIAACALLHLLTRWIL